MLGVASSRSAPVTRFLGTAQRLGRSLLGRADAACNALYSSSYNPLYHSGALAAAAFLVLVVTGLYLLLFYRIGAPYDSVARLADQTLSGQWIRSLHRYASDLALVAVGVHAIRMFVQDRAWGPRVLAWVSGIGLAMIFLICGWTGYVMVWDVHGQVLAQEGARLMDLLPIFSEPLGRTFGGERPPPNAFFFLNYFAHIALPVGVGIVLWVHLSRLARPSFLPSRPLLWGMVALLTAVSVSWPAPLPPEADLLQLPTNVPFDVFYGFWVPITRRLPAGAAWLLIVGTLAAALAVPRLTRPAPSPRSAPSWVNPLVCTGCEQCYHDCPYEAIRMVRRQDGREGFVGFVDPHRCVSCGICSGSCAPMVVGPPERTGRDQLAAVERFLSEFEPRHDSVVLVSCDRSAAGRGAVGGTTAFPVTCAGAVHTSVIEYLVRAGFGGVLIVACPTRDCWHREGGVWLEERIYHEREAELKARVDRRRVRIVHAAAYETALLEGEVARFRKDITALDATAAEPSIDIVSLCEAPSVSVSEEVDA